MSGKVVDNCHAAFFAVFAWLRWLFVPCSAFPIDYVYRVTIYLWGRSVLGASFRVADCRSVMGDSYDRRSLGTSD